MSTLKTLASHALALASLPLLACASGAAPPGGGSGRAEPAEDLTAEADPLDVVADPKPAPGWQPYSRLHLPTSDAE